MAKYILGNALRKQAQRRPLLQRLLWAVDLLLIGLLYGLLRLLPVRVASALGRRLGRLAGPALRSRSQHIRNNLQVAFPDMPAEEVRALVPEVWGNAGAVLAEYAHMARLSAPGSPYLDIRFMGEPPQPQQPAIYVSAHQANWEVAGGALSSLGVPFTVLYTPPDNPWLDRLLVRSRRVLNCELLPRENSMRPLLRALQSGRSAAMVMDRRTDEGEAVPLFGHDKPTSTLPARLALKFDCPLIPIRVERLPRARFRVTFYPALSPTDATQSTDAIALDLTGQINRLFEQWISERPGEWFCSKRIWPKGILPPKAARY